MFFIDLHVHTRRYSPCAELLSPERIPAIMTQRNLHGLVLAEHDILWPREELEGLNSTLSGRRIYGGVEVTTDRGHMVVIGLNDMKRLPRGVAIQDLICKAQEEGAAVIYAHPFLYYPSMAAPLTPGVPARGIDAIETASSVTTGEDRRKALQLATTSGLKSVAGSDAHCEDTIGVAVTAFPNLPRDEKQLAAAIRNGSPVAMVTGESGTRRKLG